MNTNLISDAFAKMLAKPVFVVHISVQSNFTFGASLNRLKGLDKANDVLRHEVANNIAQMLVVSGIHVTSITAKPAEGIIAIKLSPLVVSPTMSDAGINAHLKQIFESIEHEVLDRSLTAASCLDWISTFGMTEPDRARIITGIAYGNRIHSIPDCYVLHELADPVAVLTNSFGKEFAEACEQVVYVQQRIGLSADPTIPEYTVALPLEQFKMLAGQYGFESFTVRDRHTLVAEKLA